MLVLVVLLLSFFSSSGCSTVEDDNEVIELSLSHFFPEDHPIETELIQKWIDTIENETNGKLRITSYPDELMLDAEEIYDGVVTNEIDIGLSVFSYSRERFPLLEVFELPGIMYNNSRVASMVAWHGIKELRPNEVKDSQLMMVFATGPGDMFSKRPIQNLEDLQGLEVRATGRNADMLDLLGATPISMSQSDTYEALQSGVVKANLSPPEVLKNWKQAEVVEYSTSTPFLYNTLFFLNINLDVWNSLSDDTKNKIESINEELQVEIAIGLWDRMNEKALKWAVEEKGLNLISLSETEMDRWKEKVKPVQQDYINKMEEQNLSGEKALEVVLRLSEKYNKIYN